MRNRQRPLATRLIVDEYPTENVTNANVWSTTTTTSLNIYWPLRGQFVSDHTILYILEHSSYLKNICKPVLRPLTFLSPDCKWHAAKLLFSPSFQSTFVYSNFSSTCRSVYSKCVCRQILYTIDSIGSYRVSNRQCLYNKKIMYIGSVYWTYKIRTFISYFIPKF